MATTDSPASCLWPNPSAYICSSLATGLGEGWNSKNCIKETQFCSALPGFASEDKIPAGASHR